VQVSDQESDKFQIIKGTNESENKISADFGKPVVHNQPRPTFGAVDVSFLLTILG